MKTRLELAHEYALQIVKILIKKDVNFQLQDVVDESYEYADMILSGDNKEVCDKRLCVDSKVVNIDEWQPDWSMAPIWANYFSVGTDGNGKWMKSEGTPYISDYTDAWFCLGRYYHSESCPSFNYKGDWKDSLRKRPEGV